MHKRQIWLKLQKKKMADNLYYFSDDEESEWLANIDPTLLHKSKEEKQLGESEFFHLFITIEAGSSVPIPFRFAYFCHDKYPRNWRARTEQFGVLDNDLL